MLRRLALALLLGSTGCSLSSEGIAGDPNPLDQDSSASGDSSATDDSSGGDSTIDPDTGTELDSGAAETDPPDGGGDSGSVDTEPVDSGAPDTTAPDTTVPDTTVPDTSTPDTTMPDTSMPDTTVVDTGPPDTGPLDTGPPDTGPPDTGPPDTGPADTGPADTGPETPAVGVLKVTHGEQPSGALSINLTTEGTIDWGHWGYGAAGTWNHKATGTALIKGTIGAAQQYGTYPSRFSWTGGTPNATVTNTDNGIYHDGNGEYFQFDAAGDATTERTLKVYGCWRDPLIGLAKTSGRVDVSLSDASATAWTGNLPPPGGSTSGDNHVYYVEIKYRPVSATGRVVVRITQTTDNGYISLLAATLK